jgi:hypothetical protein
MINQQIIGMQKRIGVEPDGFWGPISIAACKAHLRALMPIINPWPKTDQVSLSRFYSAAGDESQLVALNVEGLGIQYDGKQVQSVKCHDKVSGSLYRILSAISKGPHRSILSLYAGVYCNRPMRGGSLPSLHARGAAIDLAPETNGVYMVWPTASSMPLEIMEEFSREGWIAAGAFWGRDGMHFQATK